MRILCGVFDDYRKKDPMQIRSILLACLLFSSVALAQESFSSAPLDTVLGYLGMTESSFVSDRTWADDDTFLLPKIRECLSSPLAAYRITKDFERSLPSSVSEAGLVNQMAVFLNAPCPDIVCKDIDAQLAASKPTAVDPFEPMLSAFALAEGYRSQAFAKLSPAEQQTLLLAAPMWFGDKDMPGYDSLRGCIQRSFGSPVDTTSKADADTVLSLLPRINRDALSAAVYAFARGLAMTVKNWKITKSPFSVTSTPGVDGLVLVARDTPYGKFVLGGSGPNTYTGDFALIIDLGGDDRYVTRVGGAVAGIGHPISAVIDMGGDDQYISDRLVNQGCGVLGIGGLVDVGHGDDEYRGSSFCQGASFCGAGFLFDDGGNDTYRADIFAQGAAVCGVAVLTEGEGRTLYDLGMYGQGFASTFGAAGLVDNGGNDVYRAGGLQTHAPLRPEDYRSFAQGFAIGSRPRGGGGFAMLHDKSGNDFYNAEVYAQGVGYWYSLGALIDDAGNDAYDAAQYSQGAGIHLAAGVLEDGGGDDRYGSRFGPGQAGAHDLAVAMFYEHGGDDQYTISGGQGMAINNSAALFYDAAGNDNYNVIETDLGQGGVREARGFGNLGVFVDAEGRDVYSVPARKDSTLWFNGVYGMGYDVSNFAVHPREAAVPDTLVPADTLRSIEDLFKDAAKWEVTDNRALVRRARQALKAKGIPAVQWVVSHKLNTMESLDQRAMVELFKVYPDSAGPYLVAALDSADHQTRRNVTAILGEMKWKPAVKPMIAKLHDPSYEHLRRLLLNALGDIGDTTATGTLIEFASSPRERERITAVVSLGKVADPRGYSAIFERLSDSLYTIRSAAIYAVAAQNEDVLPSLQEEMSTDDTQRLETLLLAASELGKRWSSNDTLKKNSGKLTSLVRRYADYPDMRVRASALAACSQVMNAKDVEKLARDFEKSTDPVVRARVRQVELKLKK
jgi:HEAT repeat protein